MELGQGIETGGVYVSSAAIGKFEGRPVDQLVLQFQINGGNAWAQGIAYGLRDSESGELRLVSLEISNMDAMLSGKPSSVAVPRLTSLIPTDVE
eukprot:8539855-Ditylum_brightwellii.AAC.1